MKTTGSVVQRHGPEPAEGRRETASARSQASAACERREWQAAFELLHDADQRGELDPEGLELLAQCARWVGRSDGLVDPLERAHGAYVKGGDTRAAVRTALALCHANADADNQAVASSWWIRADTLIGELGEGPEHGLHALFQARMRGLDGDLDGQEEAAQRAYDIACRFADRNVEALASVELGHVATARGRPEQAREAIEHATSLALGGEIGVLESGFVFCNAIWCCRCRGEWGRALEWTDSADRWQAREQVAYFPGLCRVHRAEVLRVRGELVAAEHEGMEAARLLEESIPRWAMIAHAELGEVRRRRGDAPAAMVAFRRARELGWDPQPGLALAILAGGDPVSAHRSLERVFQQPQPTKLLEDRANLLAARVTIAIAADVPETAERAAEALEELARASNTPWDAAKSAQARGELALAGGDLETAVASLSKACGVWADLDTPYELATCRETLGRALQAAGDCKGATLELEAAKGGFERIRAVADVERVAGRLAAEPAHVEPVPVARELRGASDGTLHREGDYWALGFEGRVVRLKDARGLRYLAALLGSPDVDHWAIDLAAGVAAPRRGSGEERAPDPGDAGELLDGQARAAYRRRLETLREELDEARANHDIGRADSIRTEMDVIGRQLAAAIGLGGRSRRSGSAVERARQSVTKAIRGTIRKIAGENESLGRYLELAVRTGVACRFEPIPRHPIRWQVETTDPAGA